jgi:uncharacterized OB-fold protein
MDPETVIPLAAALVLVAIVLLLWRGTGPKHGAAVIQRPCRFCGAMHPPFARYCPQCGRAL